MVHYGFTVDLAGVSNELRRNGESDEFQQRVHQRGYGDFLRWPDASAFCMEPAGRLR